jgi:hypothetical protein
MILPERVLGNSSTTGEIAAAARVTAPTVSQHLRVLRDAGWSRCGSTAASAVTGLAATPWRLCSRDCRRVPALDADHDLRGGRRHRPRRHVAMAAVELDCPRPRVFAGFTDAALCSRWLGAPVHLDGGRFAATLEWGTQVRGRYGLVVTELIVCPGTSATTSRCPVRSIAATPFAALDGGRCRVRSTSWSAPPNRPHS